jgi:hypothetical protein
MGLLYILFSKFVPIIAIWELKVGSHKPVIVRKQVTVVRESGGATPLAAEPGLLTTDT